jgi:hypothetical protein
LNSAHIASKERPRRAESAVSDWTAWDVALPAFEVLVPARVGAAGAGSYVYEVTQESTPQTVWSMQITGTNLYRAFRIPSLYREQLKVSSVVQVKDYVGSWSPVNRLHDPRR